MFQCLYWHLILHTFKYLMWDLTGFSFPVISFMSIHAWIGKNILAHDIFFDHYTELNLDLPSFNIPKSHSCNRTAKLNSNILGTAGLKISFSWTWTRQKFCPLTSYHCYCQETIPPFLRSSDPWLRTWMLYLIKSFNKQLKSVDLFSSFPLRANTKIGHSLSSTLKESSKY